MRPTSDDFEPRRDGWYEHRGTWAEVTIGTVIASQKRSERWEIIDQAHGKQVEFGHTLMMRAREQTTGVEYTMPPRMLASGVKILTRDPRDTKTADVTWPSDSDAVELLVRELGAEVMATRNLETGEIVCPDYITDSHHPEDSGIQTRRGFVEHMRFAHHHPVGDDIPIADLVTLHGQAHSASWPNIGKGGFPHRHEIGES